MGKSHQTLRVLALQFLALFVLAILVTGTSTSAESAAKSRAEWIEKTIQFEKSEDWRGLVKHATAWTEESPEEGFAWYSLYVAYERQGNTKDAINAVSTSLNVQSELLDFWMKMSNDLIKEKANDDAVNISRGILKVMDFKPALKNLGYGQMRMGSYIEAASSLERYVDYDPSDKLSFFYLGLIYDNSRQYESAIDYLQRALEIDPTSASVWYQLAYTFHKLDGNNSRALGAYKKLKNLDQERASDLARMIGITGASSTSPSTERSRYEKLEANDRLISGSHYEPTGQKSTCNCKGYSGVGGACYNGPGGPAYDGPGGPAYRGPGGACYAGPGGPQYNGPGGPAYNGPGGPLYDGPGGPAYDGPGGPAYSGPGGACYAGPGGPCYSGPGASGKSCPAICK